MSVAVESIPTTDTTTTATAPNDLSVLTNGSIINNTDQSTSTPTQSHPGTITRILPYLSMGGQSNAENLSELHSNGITHIINVTTELPNYFPDEFIYRNDPLSDYGNSKLLELLDDAVQFIVNARQQQPQQDNNTNTDNHIFVHCSQGISRSAAVVAAYLLYIHPHWTVNNALQYISQCRSQIDPNPGFKQQLKQYWQKLHPNHQITDNSIDNDDDDDSTIIETVTGTDNDCTSPAIMIGTVKSYPNPIIESSKSRRNRSTAATATDNSNSTVPLSISPLAMNSPK